ncbi:MAG: hypothetical protein WBQ65_01150 [Bryobacteraceae bacterium]
MKRSKPPALATWLLEHARFTTTDVIAGDLLEEFNKGRSAAWYWRQALVAIVAGCASEVRHHRVLAARAILITWAANYGALLLGRLEMIELSERHFLAYNPQLAVWAICFLGSLASGLIVALLHRGHRNAMLLTGAAGLLGWALMAILFFRAASLQHPLLQIIAEASIVDYLVILAGFAIGGFLLTPAPKPGAPSSGNPSPAY